MIDKNAIGKAPKLVKICNVIRKIVSIIFSILFISIISVNAVLIVKTFIDPTKTPDFLGYKCFVITSGSMEPTIHTGDFIVSKEVKKEDIKKEDIITFKSGKTTITHRIINISNNNSNIGLTTKGDNNNVEDSGTVKENQIEGKYLFTIPILGNVVLWSQTTIGLSTLIIVPVVAFVILFWRNQKTKTKNLERETKRIKYKNLNSNTIKTENGDEIKNENSK